MAKNEEKEMKKIGLHCSRVKYGLLVEEGISLRLTKKRAS